MSMRDVCMAAELRCDNVSCEVEVVEERGEKEWEAIVAMVLSKVQSSRKSVVSAEESVSDRALKFAVEEMGMGHEWEAVAEVVSGRKAADCLERYQRRLNSRLRRRAWTRREDEVLKSFVVGTRALSTEKTSAAVYRRAASVLPGRSGDQCRERWLKSNLPSMRKGLWSATEEKRARLARRACKDWWRLRAHVPTRSDAQCREKWTNVLDPTVKRDVWTTAEDAVLKDTVDALGIGNWAQVAQHLPLRTDNQCLRRWYSICHNTPPSTISTAAAAAAAAPRDNDDEEGGNNDYEE